MKHKVIAIFSILITIVLITTACANILPVKQDIKTKLTKTVESYVESNDFSGYIFIVDQGKVVFDQGYGMADYETKRLNTRETPFAIGSVTKQFTAMAIMMLEEQGLLKVEDPISNYLPDFTRGDEITIHQLLNMSAGVSNKVDGLLPVYDPVTQKFNSDGSNTRKDEVFTPQQIIDLFKDLPLSFAPGSKFEYSNSNYILLGAIIEKVSQMSYAQFIQTKIFQPLEMDHSGYDLNSTTNGAIGYNQISPEPIRTFSYNFSMFYACGGLYSTVDDLYKWEQALYTEKLVSKETMAKIFTPYTQIDPTSYKSYGYGWVVYQLAKIPQVEHDGVVPGYLTDIFHSENNHRAIIIVCNNMSCLEKFPIFQQALVWELNAQ